MVVSALRSARTFLTKMRTNLVVNRASYALARFVSSDIRADIPDFFIGSPMKNLMPSYDIGGLRRMAAQNLDITQARESKLAYLLLSSGRIAAFNQTFGWKTEALEKYVDRLFALRSYDDWRKEHKKTKERPLDLRGVNLAGLNLGGVKLAGADLAGANLEGADLTGADLRETNFEGANLKRAILADAKLMSTVRMSNYRLEDEKQEYRPGANFTNADLTGADLGKANANKAIFVGTILRNAILSHASMRNVDISSADFTGAEGTPPYISSEFAI